MALPIFATSFRGAGEQAPGTAEPKEDTMVWTAGCHLPSFLTCAVIAVLGQSEYVLLPWYPVANGRVQTSAVAGAVHHNDMHRPLSRLYHSLLNATMQVQLPSVPGVAIIPQRFPKTDVEHAF